LKKILLIAAGFIGLLIISALVAPLFIDLGNYKSQFLPLAERALGRRVDVGEVRLRVLPRPRFIFPGLKFPITRSSRARPFSQRSGLASCSSFGR